MKKLFSFLFLVFLSFWACKPKPKLQTYTINKATKVETKSIIDTIQEPISTPIQAEKPIPPNPRKYYWQAFEKIKDMLDANQLDFKKAVFITENAWFEDSLSFSLFINQIQYLAKLSKKLSASKLIDYEYPDFEAVNLNAAIFKVLTDSTVLVSDEVYISTPYKYDFEDFAGKQDWANMFVLKLLATHKGNCHSLPFLYKMIALELNAKVWLAFAPHHIYIKSKAKKTGMFNTELTSAEFPTDAWIACSGYISTESIQSGIYMDTVSLKKSVSYTLYDLAKGYQRKFGTEDGEFITTCTNELLNYFPNCINGLLLKADVLTSLISKQKPQKENQFQELEKLMVHINQLGYNEMPQQNYLEWLRNLQTAKGENHEINTIFRAKSK